MGVVCPGSTHTPPNYLARGGGPTAGVEMLLRITLLSAFFVHRVIYSLGDECVHGDIRLVNGFTHRDGLLEACHMAKWYTICDDDFRETEALVACQQLFMSKTIASTTRFLESLFKGSGNNVIKDLNCNGGETSLLDCSYNPYGLAECGHLEDIGLRCYIHSSCSEGDVRLVGGRFESEGRVEICRDSVWAAVSYRGWDEWDAQVLCRQLGFPYQSPTAVLCDKFGRGEAPLEYYDFKCSGSEVSLVDCGVSEVTRFPQRFFHDDEVDEGGPAAGVMCNDVESMLEDCSVENQVRLTNGSVDTEGRLEVCREGAWRGVCGDGFNQETALAVCKSLGYSITGRGPFFYTKGQLQNALCEERRQLVSSLHCLTGLEDIDQCVIGDLRFNCCACAVGVSCIGAPDIEVTIQYTTGSGDASLTIGSQLTLTCNLKASSYDLTREFNYNWSTSAPSSILSDPTSPNAIVTIPTNHETNGEYFCSVYDGETLIGVGSITLKIEALIRPSVAHANKRQTISGEQDVAIVPFSPFNSVTLHVEAPYLPTTVVWYKNKIRIAPNEKYFISDDTLSMTISGITAEDRDVYLARPSDVLHLTSVYDTDCKERITETLDSSYPAAKPASFILLPQGSELDLSENNYINRTSRYRRLTLPLSLNDNTQMHFQWDWLQPDFIDHVSTQWFHDGNGRLPSTVQVGSVTDKLSGYYTQVSLTNATVISDGLLTGSLRLDTLGYLNEQNCSATLLNVSDFQYLTLEAVNLDIHFYEPYILVTVPSAAAAISNTEELSLICYVMEGYSQPPVTLQWRKEEEELSFVTLDNGNTTQLNLLAGQSNCYGEYNCVVRVSPQLEFIEKVLVEEIALMQIQFEQSCDDQIDLQTLANRIVQSLLAILSELCTTCELTDHVFQNYSASCSIKTGERVLFLTSVVYSDNSGSVTASALIDLLQIWVIRSQNGELSIEDMPNPLLINKECFLAISSTEEVTNTYTPTLPSESTFFSCPPTQVEFPLLAVVGIAICGALVIVLIFAVLLASICLCRTRLSATKRSYSPEAIELHPSKPDTPSIAS